MSDDKGKGEVRIQIAMQVGAQPRRKHIDGGVLDVHCAKPVSMQATFDVSAVEAAEWNHSMTQQQLKERMSIGFLKRVMNEVRHAAAEAMPKEPHTAKIYWTETVNYEATVQIDVPLDQDPCEYIHSYVLDGSGDRWLPLVSKGPDNCRCIHIYSVDERQVRHIDTVKKKDKE